MKIPDRFKSKKAIGAMVLLAVTLTGGSLAIVPGVTEAACLLIGC